VANARQVAEETVVSRHRPFSLQTFQAVSLEWHQCLRVPAKLLQSRRDTSTVTLQCSPCPFWQTLPNTEFLNYWQHAFRKRSMGVVYDSKHGPRSTLAQDLGAVLFCHCCPLLCTNWCSPVQSSSKAAQAPVDLSACTWCADDLGSKCSRFYYFWSEHQQTWPGCLGWFCSTSPCKRRLSGMLFSPQGSFRHTLFSLLIPWARLKSCSSPAAPCGTNPLLLSCCSLWYKSSVAVLLLHVEQIQQQSCDDPTVIGPMAQSPVMTPQW